MPIANVARRIIANSGLAAILACAGSAEQLTPDADLAAGGTYVLRAVAATAPPTVWISNESVSITVLADTLILDGRGQGRRVAVQRYREASVPEPFVRREEAALSYVRRGDRIEITLACPDLALCIAPPHFVGRGTSNGLLFETALNYAAPLRYERVRR
jgi:hypothetical protein